MPPNRNFPTVNAKNGMPHIQLQQRPKARGTIYEMDVNCCVPMDYGACYYCIFCRDTFATTKHFYDECRTWRAGKLLHQLMLAEHEQSMAMFLADPTQPNPGAIIRLSVYAFQYMITAGGLDLENLLQQRNDWLPSQRMWRLDPLDGTMKQTNNAGNDNPTGMSYWDQVPAVLQHAPENPTRRTSSLSGHHRERKCIGLLPRAEPTFVDSRRLKLNNKFVIWACKFKN